ncbi:hypothetical protein G6N05_05395 [Flavobacterium sp. F372]|uniref:Uncharacterized protein n=1 Tax=Flavobacterium bernardetii TaxID=2813823 RepID=A0ABR7J1A2_9FLAO|nr:hypothetical protein [Flavobacterium bernardetii]MBC5835815.1 hypothetical protein [Flavobacterium bernardetii]NHF69545.1 hypothetical protein [Flavobacterium bernardetii]
MRVVAVPTTNGIDDIKLIAETDSEAVFIRQLAEAGTLSSLSTSASSSVVFRAISVQSTPTVNDNLISRGKVGKYDFSVRQNESHAVGMTFIKADVPLDLTAYTAIKLQVKSSKHSSAILTLDLTAGLAISGDDNNVLNISMTANQTKELCNETYYYDILFTGTSTNIYYIEGKITVKKSVTR